MDYSDYQYIIELLESSVYEQEWDGVNEAIETLKEFKDISPFEEME